MKLLLSILPVAALARAQYASSAQIPIASADSAHLTIDGIPLLGYGTWNLDKSNASEAVSWAIQTGYRHIDCAAAYGNEEQVGRGIADGLLKTGLKRQDLWITSKLWNDHHGLQSVEPAIDTTLEKLGVGYLDLYHMHWPVSQSTFGSNSIEYLETYGAMALLVSKGKARHIGVSNFSPAQLKDLLNHTSIPPAVHQMEMHPYLQQRDWLALHQKHGIHVTAYSPLGGANAGSSGDDAPEPLLNNSVVRKIASKRGCTPAQVVLQWAMQRGTSVIPKSAHAERISENWGALECELKKKDVEKIDKLGKARHRYVNPAKSWGVDLYEGLEDSKGKGKKHS